MAKKVVAKGKQKHKAFAKVIRAVYSSKSKSYGFKEEIVPIEDVKDALAGKRRVLP